MADAGMTQANLPATTPRTTRHWVAAAVTLAALAAFVAVLLATESSRRERTGRGVSVPATVHHSPWAVATHDGWVRGALDEVALSPASGSPVPLVGLAIDPTSGGVFGADPSGRLRSLHATNESGARNFTGLLAGYAALDDGRIALLTGRSGFGADYSIRLIPTRPGAPSEREVPLGFCTRLLAGDGRSVVYATKQARVGRIDSDGNPAWENVLPQMPTALAAARDGGSAVGDERGGIHFLDANGGSVASGALGERAIVALAFVRGGEALAAVGKTGVLGVFNRRGHLLGRYDTGAGTERIAALLETDRDLLAVTSSGKVWRVPLPAVLPVLGLEAFERLRAAALVSLALVAAAGVFAFSRRSVRTARMALRRVGAARVAYFLLLPTFLLLAVFNYYPMATALGYSFWKFSLTTPMEFVGWDNFRQMADDPYLRQGTLNMVLLLATGIVKLMALPLLAAELVFWIASPRWQQFFRAAVTFPAVVPGVVMVLVWKMIYDPYSGLLNLLLKAAGLETLQHAWLGDEHTALWAVVFFNFPWINLLIFLIFLGGLLQIDRNLFEAADMDGASVAQRFVHIDLPALRPKLQVALTLIFLWSVQDYASVLILTGGGPGVSTYVPALQMFEQISGGQNLGYSSAIGLVLFALVLGFTLLSRRLNREDAP